MQLKRVIDLSGKFISNCAILKSFSIAFRVKEEEKKNIFIAFLVSKQK